MEKQVTEKDRQRWNQLYAAGSHLSLQPDSFFVSAYERFVGSLLRDQAVSGRRALDIAGGVGRHALFLAQRGWHATLNDLSDDAVQLAARNSAAAGLTIELRQESARATLQWSADMGRQYALIDVLFYLDRSIFTQLEQALAPGGLLLLKTRTEDHPRYTAGSDHPEYFLRRGELAAAFPALKTLHFDEQGGLAELVAAKS